jgi:hypothetical protein
MLPAMKKVQAREEKIDATMREMFPDIPEGVDPVDLIIEQMFAGFVPQTPTYDVPTEEKFEDAATHVGD